MINIANLIQENTPLAPFTTLGIGGPARYFLKVRDEVTIPAAVNFARARNLPIFILGSGSNLLIADEGFPGLILQIALTGISSRMERSQAIVTASAGENWDKFVASCVAHGFAGIECLSGIPGSVGGTPIQNVGAYGQEVSETIVTVRAYDRDQDRTAELSRDDCNFSYRASIFNTTARDRFIVLAVSYRLIPNGVPTLRYRDVQEYFAGKSPTLAEVSAAVRSIRARKGMVIDPADTDTQSVGSFFKNPVVTREQFEEICASVAEEAPHFAIAERGFKIPAAWLIESAGFNRGYARGRAAISNKHPLALINRGGATAREIIELAREIQERVFNRFGVTLVPEPVFVGLDEEWTCFR